MECIFCKIVRQQLELDLTVYEDEYVIGLISLHQKAENFGHVLLLPKIHIDNLYELPKHFDAPVMSALRIMARAVKKEFLTDGILIQQNNEAAAGQDVFHLHFHIIPRFEGDKFEQRPYKELSLDIRKTLAARLKLAVLEEILQQVPTTKFK